MLQPTSAQETHAKCRIAARNREQAGLYDWSPPLKCRHPGTCPSPDAQLAAHVQTTKPAAGKGKGSAELGLCRSLKWKKYQVPPRADSLEIKANKGDVSIAPFRSPERSAIKSACSPSALTFTHEEFVARYRRLSARPWSAPCPPVATDDQAPLDRCP